MSQQQDSTQASALEVPNLAGLVRRVKLVPPAPLPDAVPHRGVAAMLARVPGFPVTLVTAPAGFGKTTQLARWHREQPGAGWISVAPEDDDPAQIVRLISAALAPLAPSLARGLDHLLASDIEDPRRIGEFLADLLTDLPDDRVLIIDDVHDLAAPGTLALLDHLLRTPPPRLHLVLAGRVDPAIPALDLLEQRGRLLRIDDRHLRFTPANTVQLLPRGTPDRRRLAETITARVEGWPAGVRAFAASHEPGSAHASGHSAGDSPAALRRFVAGEVLARQPADAVDLLSACAVLTHFTPELAAVMHGGITPAAARRLLDGLVAARAFTTSDGQDGYRVHAVVRDTLQELLGAEAVAASHAAAAEWFATHRDVPAATMHALAASPEVAACLIERHVFDWFLTEHWGDIRAALDRLPGDLVQGRPALLIAYASSIIPRGMGAQAAQMVDRAEKLLDASDPAASRLRWEAAATRCVSAQYTGSTRAMIDLGRALIDAGDASVKAVSEGIPVWGFGMIELGRLDEAERALAAIATGAGPATLRLAALLPLMGVASDRLDPGALASWARMATTAPMRSGSHRFIAWGHFGLSLAAYHRNDFAEADENATAGQHLASGMFFVADQQFTILRAQIAAARGDLAEALAIAADDERMLERVGVPALMPIATALRVRYAAMAGDYADLDRTTPEALVDAPIPHSMRVGDPVIGWAAALLSRNQPGDAERAVALLERRGRSPALGRLWNRANLLPVLAAAHEAAGDRCAALAVMAEALRLDSSGMLRYYADAGPFALAVLAALAETGDPAAPAAGRVLAAIAPPPADPPIDLTPREQEVMALMKQWKTNKEIGERLGISPNTVRQHSMAIFRKLGVGDRREAVARFQGSATRDSSAP